MFIVRGVFCWTLAVAVVFAEDISSIYLDLICVYVCMYKRREYVYMYVYVGFGV